MIITPDTTLEQLLTNDVISRRTFNVLTKMNVPTVGALRDMPLEVFARTRNCGRRTILEIDAIKKLHDTSSIASIMRSGELTDSHAYIGNTRFDPNVAILNNSFQTVSLSFDDYIVKRFKEVYGVNFMIISRHLDQPRDLLDLTRPEGKAIPEGRDLRQFLMVLVNDAAANKQIHTEHRFNFLRLAEQIRIWTPYYDELDRLDRLDPMLGGKLEMAYRSRYNAMSVRAQNCFRQYDTLDKASEIIFSPNSVSHHDIRNCGSKTLEEFQTMTAMFADYYRSEVESAVNGKSAQDYRKEYVYISTRADYPFLSPVQHEKVVGLTLANGSQPAALMLYYLLMNGSDTTSRIIRTFYGFDPHSPSGNLSMTDTAAIINVSRERVRQVLALKLSLPASLDAALSQFSFASFSGDVLTLRDPRWKELIDKEQLPLTPAQLMGLFCSVHPDYKMIRTTDPDKCYACTLSEKVRFRFLFTAATTLAARRSTDDIRMTFARLADSPDGFSDDVNRTLSTIFSDFFADRHNVAVDDTGITVGALRLDKVAAIEGILAERGSAMPFDDLMKLYNERYPDFFIDSKQSFRSYILRSEKILPKGKTGEYVLRDWEGEFTGTISDYLYYVLDMFDTPLSLDQLTEYTVRQFPRTNSRSINALMFIDSERFVKFKGDRYGITSKTYDEPLCVPRIVSRQTPAQRYVDYESFVVENRHFPFLSADPVESSLSRWATSLRNGVVDDTENILQKIDALIERFPLYPRNGNEYQFYMSCQTVADIFRKTGVMPSPSEYSNMYVWFRKNYRRRNELSGNCRVYFSDLLAKLQMP